MIDWDIWIPVVWESLRPAASHSIPLNNVDYKSEFKGTLIRYSVPDKICKHSLLTKLICLDF